MSAREFAEWIAYAGMEPFGETRADIRMATVAALLAEANRDRKRRRKAFSVGEFVSLFRGGGVKATPSPGSVGPSAHTADDVQVKKAELWANVKAWATRGQRASALRSPGNVGSAQTVGVGDSVHPE